MDMDINSYKICGDLIISDIHKFDDSYDDKIIHQIYLIIYLIINESTNHQFVFFDGSKICYDHLFMLGRGQREFQYSYFYLKET